MRNTLLNRDQMPDLDASLFDEENTGMTLDEALIYLRVKYWMDYEHLILSKLNIEK